MKKPLIYVYLCAIHVFIIYILYNPYFFENQRWRFGFPDLSQGFKEQKFYNDIAGIRWHNNINRNIIVGDSHLRRFDHSSLNKTFINLAIGGQTSDSLKFYLSKLSIAQSANNIILLIGTNDLLKNNSTTEEVLENIKDIYTLLRDKKNIYIITLPPVGKKFQGTLLPNKIKTYNQMLKYFCFNKAECSIIDIYPLLTKNDLLNPRYNSGDDLHINAEAYDLISNLLNGQIK